MDSTLRIERRRHRRYIVPGHVRFRINMLEASGVLVNFGQGGLLLRSSVVLPVGTHLTLRVTASCYPYTFEVTGEVVGGKNDLKAIRFSERPNGVLELLHWLEQENVPWTGTIADIVTAPGQSAVSVAPPQGGNAAELEPELECLYQQG